MFINKILIWTLTILMFSNCANQKNPALIIQDTDLDFFRKVFIFKAGSPYSFNSPKKNYLYFVHETGCSEYTQNNFEFVKALVDTLKVKQCQSGSLNRKFYENSTKYFKNNINKLFCFDTPAKKISLNYLTYREYEVCRCITFLYFPKEIEEFKKILDEMDDCETEDSYSPYGGAEG